MKASGEGLSSKLYERKEERRILLVDDHPPVREALTFAVEDQNGFTICGETGSVDEAMTLVQRLMPDAAIIDISLLDAHGLDLVENIHNLYPNIRVIVYSMYDETIYAERALKVGALAYVMKTAPLEIVIEALHTVLNGNIYVSPNVSKYLLTRSLSNTSPAKKSGLEDFTDRELAVFQMLGEGYSIEDIADRLRLTRKATEHHRRRVKEKLGIDSVNDLVHYAVRWTHTQSSTGSP